MSLDWLSLLENPPPPLPRNTPRTVRQGIREHQRFELVLREEPEDANYRLPPVPAGHRGETQSGAPCRARKTHHAREQARSLVFRWCSNWTEYQRLMRQLGPLSPRAGRVLNAGGTYRHPVPGNDAKGPLCRGFPACPWCSLYMYRRALGEPFVWAVANRLPSASSMGDASL